MSGWLVGLVLTAVAIGAGSELSEWRKAREESLRGPSGWLSVAGLFWLTPDDAGNGEFTIGSGPDNKVQLPASAAVHLGVLSLKNKQATLTVADGESALVNGKVATKTVLKSDATDRPDTVQVADLKFRIIERGGRVGVRLYDPNAKTRTEFKGLKWFEPTDKYVVTAKFTPYVPHKEIRITNILGDTAPVGSPGYVTFSIDGKEYRLDAESEGDGLFFNFKDLTNGKTTYAAGRFLNTDKPKDGVVTIDFNRATNPPCAYTAFATCPLAPKSNYLPVAIPAGEQFLGHH